MLVGIAVAVTVVLVGGSLLAVHTQSQGYRTDTTSGYAALADPVAAASTVTGARLSALMAGAPTLTNEQFPFTARGVLQQGLDAAVRQTADQASEASTIASPPPVAGLSGRFTQVMEQRASATEQLRTTIDGLLGMRPLPVAGEPGANTPTGQATLISADQAAAEMAAEGRMLEEADTAYRSLRVTAAAQHPTVRLRPSVWVPPPLSTAPLGSSALGSTATALASSTALVPFHHLVVTAVGLSPPAVPSGGPGTVSTSCITPASTVPGATPTVVPPTSTITALVTVTNCGNVVESGVTVTASAVPADPAGAAPPPAGGQGGRAHAVVAIASGSSTALDLGPLPVADGHHYTVTVSVSLPPGQVDPTGATQEFLVAVTA